MAYTEFYCDSTNAGASNMNGGGLANNSLPTASPSYSATNGSWNSSTGIFIPTTGNPSLSVNVGDWANVFIDGATVPVFIGRVTTVTITSITVSLTIAAGTQPSTGATGISINVGGRWLGPNGSVHFPFGFITNAMVDANADITRVNFIAGTSYAVTTTISQNVNGPIVFQGCTSTAGDGGRATIDGGSSGGYIVLTFNTSYYTLADLIIQNNGNTGTHDLVQINAGDFLFTNVVFSGSTGNGVDWDAGSPGCFIECEFFNNNTSNASNVSSVLTFGPTSFTRCYFHNNVGSHNSGIYITSTSTTSFTDCIFDSNTTGIYFSNTLGNIILNGCDFYNNTDGVRSDQSVFYSLVVENCNFIGNSGNGINFSTTNLTKMGIIRNCGVGSGTQANGANFTNTGGIIIAGTVTYGSNLSPWTAPSTGNFSISLTAAENAGRGNFTETGNSKSGTIGYPVIGAAEPKMQAGTKFF